MARRPRSLYRCTQNLFDLRRMAVVHNLHVIARMPEATVEASAG
ncbi:MAG TPA: hypothetical protein V6D26_09720 [Stenomitos sp.]